MNEIIEHLITWCVENGYATGINLYSAYGGFWVDVTLKKYKDQYSQSFYIAGGVLNIENWRASGNEDELNQFLKDAEQHFKYLKSRGGSYENES